jgi:hypothetical protein
MTTRSKIPFAKENERCNDSSSFYNECDLDLKSMAMKYGMLVSVREQRIWLSTALEMLGNWSRTNKTHIEPFPSRPTILLLNLVLLDAT